jgi:hypothetical protein
VSVVESDDLEDEGIATSSVLSDPVDTDDECALCGFDEFVGADFGVAGALGRPLLLLFEDRPSLFRPLSARCRRHQRKPRSAPRQTVSGRKRPASGSGFPSFRAE